METIASDHPRVLVVLSTWNGENYLVEQIESIRSQTTRDWTLLIRDDGSTDSTNSLLTDSCTQDSRIELFRDGSGRLGPAKSFGVLMQAALDRGADYVFLADQDDVWHPEKIASQLRLMQQTEPKRQSPTLVYCDLAVVDRKLNQLNPSFIQMTKPPSETPRLLAALLARNYVPGCSMMLNRSLLQLSLPLPLTEMLHDHWIALCASSAGNVSRIQRPLLQYRRHDHNVTPTGLKRESLLTKMRRFCAGTPFSHEFLEQRWQIVEAAEVILQRLSLQQTGSVQVLSEFCRAFNLGTSSISRILALWRLGLPVGYTITGAIVYYMQIYRLSSYVEGIVPKQEAVDAHPNSEPSMQ